MQNDDTPAPQGKKTGRASRRRLIVGLLFFVELAVMYIIQNTYACASAKATFVGIVILAFSLAVFFTAVNICARK